MYSPLLFGSGLTGLSPPEGGSLAFETSFRGKLFAEIEKESFARLPKGMSVFVEVNLNSSPLIAGTVVFLCTFEQALPAFKEQ